MPDGDPGNELRFPLSAKADWGFQSIFEEDESWLEFDFSHPDSEDTLRALSPQVGEDVAREQDARLNDGRPIAVGLEFTFIFRDGELDDDLCGDLGKAVFIQTVSGGQLETSIAMSRDELVTLVGWPLRQPSKATFRLLRLLCLLIPDGFSHLADEMLDAFEVAQKVRDKAHRIARGREGGPKIPLDPAEFIERLRDLEADVWAIELKEFVGWKKSSTMKEHLQKAGILPEERGLRSFRMRAGEVTERLVPYFEGLRPQDPLYYEFLERLEEAEVIPRPRPPHRT